MSEAIPVPFGCDETCNGVNQIVTTPGPSGSSGTPGANGDPGANAFTLLTAGFNQPAVNADVSVSVEDNSWAVLDQIVFVETAGYMKVVGLTSTTGMDLKNLGYTGNAAPATPVANASKVSPGGYTGTNGTNGVNGAAGINSFTVTTANFTMPASGASIAGVLVNDGTWIGIGQTLFVETAGTMQCTAKASNFSITLKNLGVSTNAAGGTNIPLGSKVSPSGPVCDASGPAGGQLKGTYPNPNLAIPNTKGALAVGNGTDAVSLPVGADGETLMADSTQTLGVKWTTFSAFLPPGIVVPYVGELSPLGWLTCQGSAVARITYAGLFAALTLSRTGDTTNGSAVIINIATSTGHLIAGTAIEGTGIPAGATILTVDSSSQVTLSAPATATNVGAALKFFPWGNGNGTTTFNVPDFRGAVPIGWETGTGLTKRYLGQKVGAESVQLATLNLPLVSPNSAIDPAMAGANAPYKLHATQWDGIGPAFSMDGSDAVNPRGGTTGSPPAQTNVSIVQPSLGVNFIIKT